MPHVLGFAFDPSATQVVLIQKNRPAWQQGKLNGVGGKIEEGETPLQAMCREFEEETGLRLDNWQHFATLIGSGLEVFCFETRTEHLHLLHSCTDEEVSVYPLPDLPEHVHHNLRYLIPLALDVQLRRPVTLSYNL
ncbi:NUDIX hydrolase [Deinococcus cellulosilyticus]|nr:NUDIX domain-containing protein [Deinococcus cellulosilyticus]